MTLRRCTPIIPVADLADAGAWFARCLGFDAQAVGDTMVHLHRDRVHIRLIQKADDMDMSDPRCQQSIYIDVDNVDALYEAHKTTLEKNGNTRAPFDRPYGMREIHIIYESLLIFFGSPIQESAQ